MNEENENVNEQEYESLTEGDRLLAVARMEQLGYNHHGWQNHPVWGPNGEYVALLLDVAAQDPSPLVRAAALRALFHEGGEDWCFSWGGVEGARLLRRVQAISHDWPWDRIDGRIAVELLKQGNPMGWRWNDAGRH